MMLMQFIMGACNVDVDFNEGWETLSEDEREVLRLFVGKTLREGVVEVTFVKKDGTERKMRCTLKEGLTQDYEKKTDKVKEVNKDVCPVYDLEKSQWRSFRYDSIRFMKVGLV